MGYKLVFGGSFLSYLSDVTVLIPVKDREEAIGKVLDEVLSIGIPRERVIVVDRHSAGRTIDIAKNGRVVVVQEGAGKSSAVKTGLKYASTKYVAVMDSDYTCLAKCIPILVKEAVEKNYSFVFSRREYGRENIPVLNRVGNCF